MAGLAPATIRQVPEEQEPVSGPDVLVIVDEEGGDIPKVDEKGNTLEIEYADGSIEFNLDGSPLDSANEDGNPEGWFSNLAEKIGAGELGRISEDLLRGISDDKSTRTEWLEDRATGLKLLGLKLEIPNTSGASDGAPVEGMSRVRHPLLLEATLRFQANARSELLPTDGPVKIRNDALESSPQQNNDADALQKDLNHYLTAIATEYYPDTDRMLLMLGFGGTAFKKVYFCPLRNRPVSETVDADDLIVNNSATDLRNAKRITHRIAMKASTVKRLQILGSYRDIPLSDPMQSNLDSVQREKKDQEGVAADTMNPQDRDREIYECYCELDISGYEHKWKGKVTGLEIPYRVTIDVSSRQILSIVRNFDENDQELPEARPAFVKYTFVPGFGFYDIGLLHILGNTTNAVTAAWRELLDMGMFANFPGFLIGDAAGRQNTSNFRVAPGSGALIKTGGMDIQKAVMPLPYNAQGMPALMQLTENIVDTGRAIGGTAEMMVGEGRADAPVGTTLAMVEQAQKVLNAVHKRMHTAQAEEFQLLVRCFREHPDSFWNRNKRPSCKWDEARFIKALNDCQLVPQADPNTASQTQRLMKIAALKMLQAANPTMYDPIAIDLIAMQALGWSNPQQFMAPPSAQGKPPPEMQEKIEKLKIEKQKADATTLDAQTRAKAQSADQQLGAAKIQMEGQGGLKPPDPAQQEENQIKVMELQAEQQDAVLDAMNRERERESRERVALVNLAKALIPLPGGLEMLRKLLPPDVIARLQENEQEIVPGSPVPMGQGD
jgi:hypothetical protein